MMYRKCAFIFLMLCLSFLVKGQIYESQSVFTNGGKLSQNNGYTHFCTVGEMAVAPVSFLAFTGNIGFLNNTDSLITLPNSIKNIEGAITTVSIYPNPNSEYFTVKFNLAESETVSVRLSGINGEIIQSRNLGNLETGEHLQQFWHHLASGVYLLTFEANKCEQSFRIVVKS